MKHYAAIVTWAWGLKEDRFFSTATERKEFLDGNEDAIDSATLLFCKSGKVLRARDLTNCDNFYSPERNMSDYEMDVYL